MLASLLPGLRELRAPLAAGYLWLVAAWLAFADRIPDRSHAHGILHKAYDLAGAIGTTTVIAAASFVAYVLGVLSVQVTASAVPGLGVFRRRRASGNGPVSGNGRPTDDGPQPGEATPSKDVNGGLQRGRGSVPTPSKEVDGALQRAIRGLRVGVATPSKDGKAALREAVLDELVQRSAKDSQLKKTLEETRSRFDESLNLDDPAVRRELLDARIDVDGYAARLEKDLPLMPLRLLGEGKQQEIYGEFDRLRAEAEFRASIALPLAVIVCVGAWRASPWWLIALVAPVMLVAEARQSVTAAADVLAESIRAHAAPSPVLMDLEAGDLQRRYDWIEHGAQMKYLGAMVSMAELCERKKDEKNAEKWYRDAAQKGDASAMFWLFRAHYGDGTQAAKKWFAEALSAEHQDAVTIAEVAGPEEIEDFKAAYAGKASALAMARVGARFEQRRLNDDAKKWYRKAIAAGYEPARDAIVKLLNSEGNTAVAEQWARRAHGGASAGDAVGLDSALAGD